MQSKKWDSHVRPIKERITDESHQSKSEKLLWLGSKNRVAIAAVMQPKSKNWTLRAQRMMTAEFWVVTTTDNVNQKRAATPQSFYFVFSNQSVIQQKFDS